MAVPCSPALQSKVRVLLAAASHPWSELGRARARWVAPVELGRAGRRPSPLFSARRCSAPPWKLGRGGSA